MRKQIVFAAAILLVAVANGTEKQQREIARAVVAAGADLVFGHGAHVNQGGLASSDWHLELQGLAWQ